MFRRRKTKRNIFTMWKETFYSLNVRCSVVATNFRASFAVDVLFSLYCRSAVLLFSPDSSIKPAWGIPQIVDIAFRKTRHEIGFVAEVRQHLSVRKEKELPDISKFSCELSSTSLFKIFRFLRTRNLLKIRFSQLPGYHVALMSAIVF